MQGIFISGTSTDVGKTHTAVLLAKALRDKNISVIPRKPVESGCQRVDGELVPADAQALLQAAHYDGKLAEVCPYRYQPPISPARAARLSNRTLTTEELLTACLQGADSGFVLIEGAGGFYSPLTEDGLNADLAEALKLPVLLVAENTLGVLNQVLLNVEAIKARGLRLAGVILNKLNDSPDGHMDNAADLRERLNCKVYIQPYNAGSIASELVEAIVAQPVSAVA
ncbi:MAG: dethiobiotin synthase [Gammaproteobacteria bacterium]|nr:dethiobiotin synthase [Gammaproteobacteria bacterium]